MCKWGDQYLIIGPGNTIRRISSVDGSEAASAGVGDYFLICDYRGGRFILADQAWNMKVLRYRKY